MTRPNPSREEIARDTQGCGLTVVLPCRGEFGLKVRYHVPAVHAMESPKLVCHEPGEECLYPSADLLWEVEGADDDSRRGMRAKGEERYESAVEQRLRKLYPKARHIRTKSGMAERRFLPEPWTPQGVSAQVVLCPRGRTYGASKNWPHWDMLLDLPGVFAAGAPDSSQDLQCPRAWDYARFLDASVEAMRQADLVISTDAGLAHLAVLCGAPLLLITHKGRVAPGPVLDPQGNAMEPRYWPVRMAEYYEAANHARSPIMTTGAWDNPLRVLRLAREHVAGHNKRKEVS